MSRKLAGSKTARSSRKDVVAVEIADLAQFDTRCQPRHLLTDRRRVGRYREARQPVGDRMWPIIAEQYKNYAGYQKKTELQIPLVLLNPA
jgi:hypothetical protein